jgi:hypothetical protein
MLLFPLSVLGALLHQQHKQFSTSHSHIVYKFHRISDLVFRRNRQFYNRDTSLQSWHFSKIIATYDSGFKYERASKGAEVEISGCDIGHEGILLLERDYLDVC